MNIFGKFGREAKPAPESSSQVRGVMPAVHAFVDVAIGASARRESVPVNDVGQADFAIRCPQGLTVGAEADFLYANASGRFRFQAKCSSIDGPNARFALPAKIKTLEAYFHRAAARVSKVVAVQWRYAPGGEGYGDYLSGSMVDISSGGASLAVDRVIKKGALVEVRFKPDGVDEPFVEVAEVVRVSKIERSTKNSAAIRFVKMDPVHQRALMKYLHELQTARRDRGVV